MMEFDRSPPVPVGILLDLVQNQQNNFPMANKIIVKRLLTDFELNDILMLQVESEFTIWI